MTTEAEQAIPRTDEEIMHRIVELGEDPTADPMGIERSRLLESLPFNLAKKWLHPNHKHTEADWEQTMTRTKEKALAQIRAYLRFAWDKANQSRGTSAVRSISHFKGLLYLIGPEQDELRAKLSEENRYRYYGKPQLVLVSEFAEVDWRKLDNDEWRDEPDDDPITADEALGD